MGIRKFETGTGVRWEVRYRINGRTSKRIKRIFETRRDAEVHYHEWIKRKEDLKLAGSGVRSFEETTFEREAQNWLLVQGQTFSPGHLKRAKGILSEILPRFGRLSPQKFQPALLSLIQSDQLGLELCHSTVNRKIEVIRAILSFSVRQKRIPYDPSNGFEKLREVRDDISFWERKEAESFLLFANEKYPLGTSKRWVFVVNLLGLNTGLRAGEIWGLQFKDIKQDGELIHVQRQFDRIRRAFRPTKGKTSRWVPCKRG